MTEAHAQALAALELGLRLSLPLLGLAFAVGLVVAALQALTRMGEHSLNAIPRAIATLLFLGSAGGWIARELVGYASTLFRALPELVR
jgi:flagellar biosynthesis protein FliQ